MAHKLEVLKPRNGAASVVAPPQMVADASLSFSFKLPASFVRPKTSSGSSSATQHQSLKLNSVPSAGVHNDSGDSDDNVTLPHQQQIYAWSDSDDENDSSWETRDLSAHIASIAATTTTTTSSSTQAAAHNDDSDSKVATTQRTLEISDAWDETDDQDDALALPDDFPLLLVNLTRLQREHFPSTASAATNVHESRADADMRHVFALVKETLHRHFLQMVEVLFEQQSCFHCTYGTSRQMLASLHATFPTDVFGVVDYPTRIHNEPLSDFLIVLDRPSRFRSVAYVRDCLRRCSRDIQWKRDVAIELDVLAEHEFAVYTTEQDRLSTEIDELTRLRDSFKQKLQTATHAQQYMLLRKLEDIENRLVGLLDVFLHEPELLERDCIGMFGTGSENSVRSSATAGMNVLDMVVAMIFSRLPRDWSRSEELHAEQLIDHHIHIRRLWKKDFGRLPPRTTAAMYAPSDDEEVETMDDAVATMALESVDDDDDRLEEAEEEDGEEAKEEDEEEDAFERLEHVAETSSQSSPESWASVQLEKDDDDEEALDVKQQPPSVDRMDDGYGADFDSDESDGIDASDHESDRRSVVAAPAVVSTRTRTRRVRRMPRTAASVASSAAVASNDALLSSRAITNAEKKDKKSKNKKNGKNTTKKDMKTNDDAVFTPFACTGALSFLRIAKENEMF